MKALIIIALLLLTQFARSEPLDNWSKSQSLTNQINTVSLTGNLLFAFGDRVFISQDGVAWTNVLPASLRAAAYGNGTYVAVGGRSIGTSSDGTNWVLRTLGSNLTVNSVAFGNAVFVAVGEAMMSWVSADGINWNPYPVTSNAGHTLLTVKYRDGVFKAVGIPGVISSSQDGVKWEKESSGVTFALHDVEYGNGVWVAVGNGGTLLYSFGEATWSQVSAFVNEDFLAVTFAAGNFVVAGTGLQVWTSRDGQNYIGRKTLPNATLSGIGFIAGHFVAAGANGGVYSDRLSIPTQPEPLNLEAKLYSGISVTGSVGYVYRIEGAETPTGPWITLGSLRLQQSSQFWLDPESISGRGKRFYRALVQE